MRFPIITNTGPGQVSQTKDGTGPGAAESMRCLHDVTQISDRLDNEVGFKCPDVFA